eukprot:s109_g54.t1
MFSDGLSDNLDDREVLVLVNEALSPASADLLDLLDHCTPPDKIAKTLAQAAYKRSVSLNATVPFTKEYNKEWGTNCVGGKQDDITVLAAWVVADESQPNGLTPHPEQYAEKAEEERLLLKEEERLSKEEEFHSKEGRRWGTLLEAMGSAKGRGSPSRRRGLL